MTLDRWLTIAGLLASALISWLVSRHFYKRADKRRIPTFALQAKRQVLSSHELVRNPGISVIHRGQEIGMSGISAVSVYFWNSGTLPILPDEVLEPYTVAVRAQILSYEVLKVSRESVGFQVQQTSETKLNLKFSVLEAGDGATIRLLYDGPIDTTIEFSGACLDAPRPVILPPSDVYFTGRRERLSGIFWVPIVLLGWGAIWGVFTGLQWVVSRLFGQRGLTWAGFGLVGVFAILALAGIGASAWEQYKKITAKYIPPDIKPQS